MTESRNTLTSTENLFGFKYNFLPFRNLRSLQILIKFWQGKKLRQIVDDRYTASVLLGLSQTFQNSMGENHNILSSANVCNAMNSCPNANANSARRLTVASNLSGSEPDSNVPHDNTDENSKQNGTTKRVRRRGKYTPQERERIRYNPLSTVMSYYPFPSTVVGPSLLISSTMPNRRN